MRHITVICDYCTAIIYEVDVITGSKYLANYGSTKLKTQSINSEYCSINCMLQQIHVSNEPQSVESYEMPSSLPPSSLATLGGAEVKFIEGPPSGGIK